MKLHRMERHPGQHNSQKNRDKFIKYSFGKTTNTSLRGWFQGNFVSVVILKCSTNKTNTILAEFISSGDSWALILYLV